LGVAFPVLGVADGRILGLPLGVGKGSDSNTGVKLGEASGLTVASGFAGGLIIAWSLSAAGEAAGKMTTRGVGEAPGSGEPSRVVEADSEERSFRRCFADRFAR
jgi:hypothetical protein